MLKGQPAADTGELIFSAYILLLHYLPVASQAKQKKRKKKLPAAALAATDEPSILPKVMLSFLKAVGSTYLL